uniref:Uncharacterized protein n=1 Tax=uncultured bacterium contig00034 TaxID=1181523 RepID=A0A806KGP2_9BACT|nr:hypothetical protein [uncultured bacterium contig00034]
MTRGNPRKIIFTPKFTYILLSCAAITLLGVLLALSRFWWYLDAYEKSQSYHFSDRIFSEYFSEIDYNFFYETERQNISKFESFGSFRRSFEAVAEAGERTYRYLPSAGRDALSYAVLSGGVKFAEFEMTRAGDVWELSGMRIFYSVLEGFTVTVSDKAAVFVNGLPVGREYVTRVEEPDAVQGAQLTYTIENMLFEPEVAVVYSDGERKTLYYQAAIGGYSDERSFAANVMDDWTLFVNGAPLGDEYIVESGVTEPELTRLRQSRRLYFYTGSFGELRLTAHGPEGAESALSDTGGRYFVQETPYREDLRDTLGPLAENAVKAYATYITTGEDFEDIRAYFEAGTAVYNAIRSTTPTGYEYIAFENAEASGFYYYGGDIYSCRVAVEQIVRRLTGVERRSRLDFTLFVVRSDGRFLVRELVSNE